MSMSLSAIPSAGSYSFEHLLSMLMETIGMINVRNEGYHCIPTVAISPLAGKNSLQDDDFAKYLRKAGMKIRKYQKRIWTDNTKWDDVSEWLAGYEIDGYNVRIHGSGLIMGGNFLALEIGMPDILKFRIVKATAIGIVKSEIMEMEEYVGNPNKRFHTINDLDKEGTAQYYSKSISAYEAYLAELDKVRNIQEFVNFRKTVSLKQDAVISRSSSTS